MVNFIIATAVFNLLNSWAVLPLSRRLLAGRLRECASTSDPVGCSASPSFDSEQRTRLANQSFLYASLTVMIFAGMLAGLLSFPVIGFPLSRRGWPGMLALCASSLIFARLRGAL